MRSEPPPGWRLARLGDLVSIEHGFAFKSKFFSGSACDVPIVVSVGNFDYSGGFRFGSTAIKGYVGEFPDRFRLVSGDVLLVMTCQTQGGEILGIPGRIPDDGRVYLHNQRLGRVVFDHKEQLDPDFAYWLFLNPAFNRTLCRTATGSKILHTAPSRIEAYAFALPPLGDQRRIASILSALDNKIGSNRRLASLLEETAAVVFRARFVDFVGVEDFEETERGRIPVGWKTGTLTDVGRFVNGKAFTKEANGQGRPILRIKELNEGVRDGTPQTDIDTADEHVARHNDILFAWSASLAVYRWSGPESLINQHIFKVIPEGYPPWFVYQWVHQHMPEFQAIARDKATTMGHIQRRHLSEARVALPGSDTLAGVSDLLEPLDRWQGILASEIASLAATRDALVPELLSGAIRVPDTMDSEEVIGPAAEQLPGAEA